MPHVSNLHSGLEDFAIVKEEKLNRLKSREFCIF